MNKLMMIMLFFCVGFTIFAEAPELKKVLPTEWKYMTQLTEQEKKEFDNTNGDAYTQEYDLVAYNRLVSYGTKIEKKEQLIEKSKVYKQTVSSDVFYWIRFPVENAFGGNKESSIISLFHVKENNIVLLAIAGSHMYNGALQHGGYMHTVNTIQIIKDKACAKGFILYGVMRKLTDDLKPTRLVKRQGDGACIGHYFLLSNQPEIKEYFDDGFIQYYPKNWEQITINASNFLWDDKDPLKYGLQNAFDGDPATSYVENTEDDLMEIEVTFPYKSFDYSIECTTISLINGYAKTSKLYSSNNRIKDVSISTKTWKEDSSNLNFHLKDNYLERQEMKLSFMPGMYSYMISVKSIFQGSSYNDTCFTDLNMKYNTVGWLFGDINE